ncbi:MAG: hypothetical protein WBQ43_16735, partial [Terriglobales bacterium]
SCSELQIPRFARDDKSKIIGGDRKLGRTWDRKLSLRLSYESSAMMAADRLDLGCTFADYF